MARQTTEPRWVCVNTYRDASAAYIDRGMLESNGIPTTLTNELISSVYPMTDTWAGVDLMVPAELHAQALKLLGLDVK